MCTWPHMKEGPIKCGWKHGESVEHVVYFKPKWRRLSGLAIRLVRRLGFVGTVSYIGDCLHNMRH
jgi:hypothetical protein